MLRPVARGHHMARLLKPATLGQRPETSKTLVIDVELLLDAAAPPSALDRQHRIAVAPPDPDLGAIATDREVTLLDPSRRPPFQTRRELRYEKLPLDLHNRIKPQSPKAAAACPLVVRPARAGRRLTMVGGSQEQSAVPTSHGAFHGAFWGHRCCGRRGHPRPALPTGA